jgi:alginate O-acetyltransferase complex protein AlgJ
MERARKIFSIILTAFFLSWISLVLLNDPFQFYKEQKISKSENRNLVRKPFFNIALLDPYPKAYEAYFNDHFIFRPQILRLNTLSSFYLFHKSPAPEDVAIGSNGWLYLVQKEKRVYNGKFKLSSSQLLGIAQELKRRAALLEQMGTKFYVAFAPMKQEIYPEYLPPDYVHCPTGTVTDKIAEMITKCKGVTLIDLKKPLLEAKKYGRLYHKIDNHWNRLGAYYAYRAITARIREDFPAVKMLGDSDVQFHDTAMQKGNLSVMIDMADFIKDVDKVPYFRHPRSKPGQTAGYKPPFKEMPDIFELVREIDDPSLPRVLVIRDSFGNAMIPFFDETFRKTVYIFDSWQYDYNKVIVENEKPDIVLLLIFEPHISHIVKVW